LIRNENAQTKQTTGNKEERKRNQTRPDRYDGKKSDLGIAEAAQRKQIRGKEILKGA